MVDVNVLSRKGDKALIQWLDGDMPRRAWLPLSDLVEVTGQKALVAHPEYGVPAGVEWQHSFAPEVTARDVQRELRRHGIWTDEDLMANAQVAIGALQALYGLDYAALVRARKEQK